MFKSFQWVPWTQRWWIPSVYILIPQLPISHFFFTASCQLWHKTCAYVKLRPHNLTDQRQCTILHEIKSLIYDGMALWLFHNYSVAKTVRTSYTEWTNRCSSAGWGCHAGILQLCGLEGMDYIRDFYIFQFNISFFLLHTRTRRI